MASGDSSAINELFSRNRPRLRQMVKTRLDPRLLRRVDASDVIQQVLTRAHAKLPNYLRRRPIGFYPWLRQIAADVLVDVHRRHVSAQRRSVAREEFCLSGESLDQLAGGMLPLREDPPVAAIRNETRERVRAALAKLSQLDREVLILRNVEQLSVNETAEVLEVPEGTVKSRHLRGLERLRVMLVTLGERG